MAHAADSPSGPPPSLTQEEANAVLESLLRVSEIGGDPTPAIFMQLFQTHPRHERLFAMDTDGSVRGSMVQVAIECIIDDIEGGETARRVIGAERSHHAGYGVQEEEFADFFLAMRDAFRETLGAEWGPAMERGWSLLLVRLCRR